MVNPVNQFAGPQDVMKTLGLHQLGTHGVPFSDVAPASQPSFGSRTTSHGFLQPNELQWAIYAPWTSTPPEVPSAQWTDGGTGMAVYRSTNQYPADPSWGGGEDPYQSYPPGNQQISHDGLYAQIPLQPTYHLSDADWHSVNSSGGAPMGQVGPDTNGATLLQDYVSQDGSARQSPRGRPSQAPAGTPNRVIDVSASRNPSKRTEAAHSFAAGDDGNAEAGTDKGADSSKPYRSSDFIEKLYDMLEEESGRYGREQIGNGPSIGWATGGRSFVIWDVDDFVSKVL